MTTMTQQDNNNNDSNNYTPQELAELTRMRSQLALLKSKLSHQNIVTEQLMRRVMRDTVRRMLRESTLTIIGVFIATVFLTGMMARMGFSTIFIVITDVMIAASVVMECVERWGMHSRNLLSGDLVQASRKMQRYKRLGRLSMRVGMPVVAVWFAWFAVSIFQSQPDVGEATAMAIGGVVGGIVGGIIGVWAYRRNMRRANQVIDQINQLQDIGDDQE